MLRERTPRSSTRAYFEAPEVRRAALPFAEGQGSRSRRREAARPARHPGRSSPSGSSRPSPSWRGGGEVPPGFEGPGLHVGQVVLGVARSERRGLRPVVRRAVFGRGVLRGPWAVGRVRGSEARGQNSGGAEGQEGSDRRSGLTCFSLVGCERTRQREERFEVGEAGGTRRFRRAGTEGNREPGVRAWGKGPRARGGARPLRLRARASRETAGESGLGAARRCTPVDDGKGAGGLERGARSLRGEDPEGSGHEWLRHETRPWNPGLRKPLRGRESLRAEPRRRGTAASLRGSSGDAVEGHQDLMGVESGRRAGWVEGGERTLKGARPRAE